PFSASHRFTTSPTFACSAMYCRARAGASFLFLNTLIVRPVWKRPLWSMFSFEMKMPRTSFRSSSLKNQPSGIRKAALIDATFFHPNPAGAFGGFSALGPAATHSDARPRAAARGSVRRRVLRFIGPPFARRSGRDQLIDAALDVRVGPADRPLHPEEDSAALVHDVGLGVLRAAEPMGGRRARVVVEGSRARCVRILLQERVDRGPV